MTLRNRSYLPGIKTIALRTDNPFIGEKEKSSLSRFMEKHGIVSKGFGVGCSEREQKCYGWSHRAIFGFGIGDKIFQERFGNDKTHFARHGRKAIRNMSDALKSAKAFSDYVG